MTNTKNTYSYNLYKSMGLFTDFVNGINKAAGNEWGVGVCDKCGAYSRGKEIAIKKEIAFRCLECLNETEF